MSRDDVTADDVTGTCVAAAMMFALGYVNVTV